MTPFFGGCVASSAFPHASAPTNYASMVPDSGHKSKGGITIFWIWLSPLFRGGVFRPARLSRESASRVHLAETRAGSGLAAEGA